MKRKLNRQLHETAAVLALNRKKSNIFLDYEQTSGRKDIAWNEREREDLLVGMYFDTRQ